MDRWQIGMLNGPALQSRGIAEADTIYLATEASKAYGSWEFTFAHRSVNLSSFNGARVFLIADRADTRKEALGYYLQLGTNNSDRISLWRADGDLRTRRVELGRSEDAILEGDSSTVRLRVERDTGGEFAVYANDSLLFTAVDMRFYPTTHFVVWIKHTAAGAESFLFDDFRFEPAQDDVSSSPLPAQLDLVINEIHFDPAPGASEFIEIFNRSDSSFDAFSLRIRDARSSDIQVTSQPVHLPPGAFLVLVQDSAAFATEFRTVPFHAVRGWPALNNSGDTIVLSTQAGTIDSVTYDGAAGIRGRSLERIDPDGPTNMANFAPSIDGFGSSPGGRNSVYFVDTSPPAIEFVDQLDPVTLRVEFSEPVRMESIDERSFEVGVPILNVRARSSRVVDVSLSSPPVGSILRVFDLSDHKGNSAPAVEAPIAFQARSGDLRINEIMYEPLSDRYDGLPDQIEYMELLNTSERLVSLVELLRTRKVDEDGDADTLRIGGERMAVEPQSFVVVAQQDRASMRAAYPSTNPPPGTVYLVAPGLSLLNGGDRVRIHNRTGEPLDDIHYEPSWHHPDKASRRGTSLERIDSKVSGSAADNWSSSVASDGGTPGASNSISYTPSDAHDRFGIQVDPSPFSPDGDGFEDVVFISYQLEAPVSNIRIRVFDINGIEVRRLIAGELTNATGRILWDGRDDRGNVVRVGIYIVVFESVEASTGRVAAYKRPIVVARKL